MTTAIKSYIIFALTFFLIDLDFAKEYKDIILRWPSVNIVSAILKIKGFEINDYFTNNILETPLRVIINLFSLLLPKDHLQLVSIYSIYSLFIKSFLPVLLIFLASCITTLLHKKVVNNRMILNYQSQFLKIFFIGNIIFYLSKQSDNLKLLFFGVNIADWGFPNALASSRGISLFISISSLVIPLLFEIFEVNINKLEKYLYITLFLINLIASLIHPISPIISLIILIFIILLINETQINFKLILLVNFISWCFGLLIIFFNFPQESIDNISLFTIYIKDSHSHHYLPSAYFLKFFNNIFPIILNYLISIFFIFYYRKSNTKKEIFTNLFIFFNTIIFIINSIQYLFVELLKNQLFMKLGLTFANITYNFIYFVSFLLFISLISINKKKIEFKEFHKIRDYPLINIKILNLTFLIFIISTFILTINVHQLNIKKVKNSLSYNLGEKISFFDNHKYEFIIDKKLEGSLLYPREIALINIFSDNYFPFKQDVLKDWRERSMHLNNFRNCINSSVKNKCYLPDSYKKYLLYVSDEKQTKLGKEIFNKEINGNNIHINLIKKTKSITEHFK